jgi:hypothetical protein
MYARYLRSRVGTDATHYELAEERVSLFGCNAGFIPWLLGFKLPPGQGEPYEWHIDVISELAATAEYANSTLLIHLKPNQNKTQINIYELMDVWGHSEHDWSPILLRLNALYIEGDPLVVNPNSFLRKDNEIEGPIYEFLYLEGSVTDGKTSGKWIAAPPSSTNGALLWPKPLNYFFKCIRATTPGVLDL